jgi:hypothetical protein
MIVAVIFLLIRITFILTSPDLPDDVSVYISRAAWSNSGCGIRTK